MRQSPGAVEVSQGRSHGPATEAPLVWACPLCRGTLEKDPTGRRCSACDRMFRRVDGIWRFLPQKRLQALEKFIREYQTIRRAEGRGSEDPDFYRALPFRSFSDVADEPWRVRAKSYQALIDRVIAPREEGTSGCLRILDLGAGNCWLSHRLADRGHEVVAVDLLDDRDDGLGCYTHYPTRIIPVQGDFSRLPFAAAQFHLAVFNASFHYSTCFVETVAEVLRVLRSDGSFTIMDTPFYRNPDSGRQMVHERESFFLRKYGFRSDSLDSENFMTFARLDQLAEELGLVWNLVRPFYGWRWSLRPWKARLLKQREPARFLLAVGSRKQGES